MSFLTEDTGPRTTKTDLAAALCAVGIPLRAKIPVRVLTGDLGERHTFFFEDRSPCGAYVTRDLMMAWDDPGWHESHPEHPFAYIKCALTNRTRLLDYIKDAIPTAAVKHGNKVAFLSLRATEATQRQVFARLKR